VENESNSRRFESVFSKKVRAGKRRTYFFDVRQTKGFTDGLQEAVDYVKTELMPDYDYDEYTRKHEEWEASQAESDAEYQKNKDSSDVTEDIAEDDISW